RLGQEALAITDHGYLFGAYDFWNRAQQHGIKPIIGMEAYLAPGQQHRSDKTRIRWGDPDQRSDDVSGGGAYTHMTLLSKNNTGMHNLFRMGTHASLDSVYAKWPRIDRELLNDYSEGIISTTGCPSGEVQIRLRLGQYKEALEAAAKIRDIFGKDNFYVEIMQHVLSLEFRVIGDHLQISKDLNLPLVASNDLQYTNPHDSKHQEALLTLQSGSKLSEPTYDEGGLRFDF